MAKADPKGLVWVARHDPWSPWSLSGISERICAELRRRGLLAAAIAPDQLTTRHTLGPRFGYRLEQKVAHLLRRRKRRLQHEGEGVVGRLLRRTAPGTPVIYVFHTPELDPSLLLRRFRWVDLSSYDAVRTGTFGHGDMSDAEVERLIAEQKRALDQADGVLALSTYAADAISHDFGYPRGKITPVGAGPSWTLPPFEFSAERYAAARILFVGRDWQRKGGDLLYKAFQNVKKEIPHATLVIVGPPESPCSGPGIKFVGPIAKSSPAGLQRLQRLFLSASVFCMPSRCEPWGLVYVEAAQAGMPIIGFDDWAMPDIVVDGSTGRLTARRDADGLAEVLVEALSDSARMVDMGRAARQRVLDVLDWPHVVDRLLSRLMPSALAGREPTPLRVPADSATHRLADRGVRAT